MGTNPTPRINMAKLTATPTVSTSAYADGDMIGGKMTLNYAVPVGETDATITDVRLYCKTSQDFDCDIVFFEADPDSTTFTDNAAVALAVADFDKVAGFVSIEATDWADLGTPSMAYKSVSIQCQVASGRALYAAIVSRDTPTLGSTSDLKLEATVIRAR